MEDTVTIIGGGIGGLTLANALHRVGIGFELYEQAPVLTEVGAGIGLSQGALHILDALGLGEAARAVSAEIDSICLADSSLAVRRRMPSAYTGRSIHRADLIDLLKAPLPADRIHLARRAVGIESAADRAEVRFEDETRVAAPCVVAADGIHSAIRKALFPDIRIRPIHQTIWRGVTEGVPHALLADAYVEIWQHRLRFLAAPLPGSRTFWLAVQPAAPGGKDTPETLKDDLVALFADYHPALRGLIRETDGPILRNDMADLGPPRQGWHHGRVVFLGDAIHATTPNLAQGGCQAMEDALCLALCLDRYRGDYETAFEAYHRLRRSKVSFVVRTSWAFGRAAHSANPLVHYGYRAMLEHAPDWLLERQARFISDLSYLNGVDRQNLL